MRSYPFEIIHDKVHKAYAMLGIINRNFKHISINSFILLYKSVRVRDPVVTNVRVQSLRFGV